MINSLSVFNPHCDRSIARSLGRSFDSSLARSIARSPARSLARSIARSLDRSLDRSIARSLDRSIARSIDQSIARSLDRSVARSLDRSVIRSLYRSKDRSFVRSLDRSLDRLPSLRTTILADVLFRKFQCRMIDMLRNYLGARISNSGARAIFISTVSEFRFAARQGFDRTFLLFQGAVKA